MNIINLSIACLILLLCLTLGSLEHEKSFLLDDSASTVWKIALYKDSLLITSSNDVLQKDIETGKIQRTFRSHTNMVRSLIVLNDSRMITTGNDDMIIIWDLETGSVLKRIWLRGTNTLVKNLAYQNDIIFTGGSDNTVRQIDSLTGRVFKTIEMGVSVEAVAVSGEFLFVGKASFAASLQKILIQTSNVVLTFIGHTDSVFTLCLFGKQLFSGSADNTIIRWDSDNGALLQSYIGHENSVNDLEVFGDDLYSVGGDRNIIKWKIFDQNIKTIYPISHYATVRCIAVKNETFYTGSGDSTVIEWDSFTALPVFVYKGRDKILRTVLLFNNYVITSGDDAEIRLWDNSVTSLDPVKIVFDNENAVNCLLIFKDTLFSGSSDDTIKQRNLTDFSIIKILLGKYYSLYLTTKDMWAPLWL